MLIPMTKLLTIAVLLVSLPSGLEAQDPAGRIFGMVTDDSGQPIVGAFIVVQHIRENISKGNFVLNMSLKTDSTGKYVYPVGLKGGTFRIIVHKEGFKPKWQENIAPAEESEINFQLQPGEDFTTPWERDLAEMWNRKANAVTNSITAALKMIDQNKFNQAIEESNKALAALYALIGDCELRLEKKEEAQAAYENALKIDPHNSTFLMNLGGILGQLGKLQEAQELYRKAFESTPLDPVLLKYYYDLGKHIREENRQK